jgi:hypothetical protein
MAMNSTESSLTSATIIEIATQYSIYSGYILFIVGIVGNAINMLVFTYLKSFRSNRCVLYLITESISNIVYQFYSIALTISTSLYGNDLTANSLIKCRIKYIFGQSCALITFYTIVISAVDQFFSISYQLYLGQMCTFELARYMVFIMITICIIHSILFSYRNGFALDMRPFSFIQFWWAFFLFLLLHYLAYWHFVMSAI